MRRVWPSHVTFEHASPSVLDSHSSFYAIKRTLSLPFHYSCSSPDIPMGPISAPGPSWSQLDTLSRTQPTLHLSLGRLHHPVQTLSHVSTFGNGNLSLNIIRILLSQR